LIDFININFLERFAARIFNIITYIKTNEKEVFLTFDDGPHPEITPWVLNLLEQYQAKATFFCVGDNVRKYPQVYQQIQDLGHIVGNHTFSHKNGFKTSLKNYIEDVEKAQSLISSPLFRPPYGKLTFWQYFKLKKHYKLVFWDVLSKDYDQKLDFSHIIARVMQKTLPGSILVFHDSEKASNNLKQALPEILDRLSRQGFKFKCLRPFE
jgi:peptidoglycan/xylan/chitin deacetylase (PgdA/CDA1 family)